MVSCHKKKVLNSKARKVIRVESEETQDYVCETRAISQEEADEMGFVSSVLTGHGNNKQVGGVRLVEANTTGERPTG